METENELRQAPSPQNDDQVKLRGAPFLSPPTKHQVKVTGAPFLSPPQKRSSSQPTPSLHTFSQAAVGGRTRFYAGGSVVEGGLPFSSTISSDYLFNLVLVGDDGVGKTSILRQLMESDSFSDSDIDVHTQLLHVGRGHGHDAFTVQLQIWDVSSSSIYETVRAKICDAAEGILLVYDVTNIASLHNLQCQLNANYHVIRNVTCVVLGNKVDLVDQRVVNAQMLEPFLKEKGFYHVETSAKTRYGIETALVTISNLIQKRMASEIKGGSLSGRRMPIYIKPLQHCGNESAFKKFLALGSRNIVQGHHQLASHARAGHIGAGLKIMGGHLMHAVGSCSSLQTFPSKDMYWGSEVFPHPPFNQLRCGCCWAASVLQCFTAIRAIRFNEEPQRFSVQYVLDTCSRKEKGCCIFFWSTGCQGGTCEQCLDFLINNGVPQEKDYVKFVDGDRCSTSIFLSQKWYNLKLQDPRLFNITSYQRFDDLAEYAIESFLQQSPVITLVTCDDLSEVNLDGNKVYTGNYQAKYTHAACLAGYTRDEWLLFNSYGYAWGDDGYFKIRKADVQSRVGKIIYRLLL